MEHYPVNEKPGPEAGWPKLRKNGNRKSVSTNKVKAAIKRIEAMMKKGAAS